MLGTVLEGRYELESLIAEGGMGAVYRALDRRLDRPVAVKLLGVSGDPLSRTRFAREARALARLSHPNINAIFDAGEQDDRPYLVLELIEGYRLSQFQRCPYAIVLELTVQALRALSYAHGQGVVHRDLKPANLLVVQEAGGSAGAWLLKVLDFGVAALTRGSRITDQTDVTGTPVYLAPEQASGDAIDGRADLYSLGVVLYELITGRPPFVNDNPVTVMFHHVNVAPEPPSRLRDGLPAPIERFVLRLLEKEPSRRYASAEEALIDLDQVKQDPSVVHSQAEAFAFMPRSSAGGAPSTPRARERGAFATPRELAFEGRDRELAELLALIRAASDGRPRVAVVGGNEGAGTSRLLRELGKAAAEEDATVYAVTCAAHGCAVPFSALARLVRAHTDATSVAEMRLLLGTLSDAVEPLLRADGVGAGDLAPPDAMGIAEAFALLVDALASTKPLVLVFDNAHELDPETLRVLRFVAGNAALPRLVDDRACGVVVVFGIPGAVLAAGTELGDLFEAMQKLGCASHVPLGMLDDAHLQAMAMSGAVSGTDASWGAAVAKLGEGTPGRLVGVLELLEETRRILPTDQGWRPAAGSLPPTSVEELVHTRLATLTAGCVATMSQVAVTAQPTDEATVIRMRAADQITEVEVRRHLVEAVAAGILSASTSADGAATRYGFSQPLVRDTLYLGMNSMRRRRLHRRAADILAGNGLQAGTSSALLTHLQALGDTSAMAACAASAARHALDAGDPREAERLYLMAIDSAGGEDGREHISSLLQDLAAVQRGNGRYRPARASLARLVNLSEQRSAWGAAAVARTESAETAACACDPEAIESDSRLALASSMQAGQAALMKRALSCLAMRQSLGGEWLDSMGTLRLADRTELGAGIRDRQASPIAHYAASLAMRQANRLLDDLAHGLAAWRGARMEKGCHGLSARALLAVTRSLIALGDAPLALSRLVRGIADLPPDAGPHAPAVIWLAMAEVRAALRDWERAERVAAAALASAADADMRVAATVVLVECCTRRGDVDTATRLLARAETSAAELGPDWHGSATAHLAIAEGWARLEHWEAASAALDRADRYAAAQQTRARLLGTLTRATLAAGRGDLSTARIDARAARDAALRQADPLVAIRARAMLARVDHRLGTSGADEHPDAGFAIAAAEAAHLGDERLAREIEGEREELLGGRPTGAQSPAHDVATVVRALKEGLVATHDRDWARAGRALEGAMRMGTSVGGWLAATCRVYSANLLMAASSPRLTEAERLLYEARRLFGSERWHHDVDEVDVMLLKLGRRGGGSPAPAVTAVGS